MIAGQMKALNLKALVDVDLATQTRDMHVDDVVECRASGSLPPDLAGQGIA